MKKAIGFCLLASALNVSGCDTRTPIMSEEEVAFLRQTYPTMIEACVEEARFEGIEMMNAPTDVCFPMEKPRQWAGLWANEFEASQFCAMPATQCDYWSNDKGVWLSFADGEQIKAIDRDDGKLYEIRFVGRRTREAGHFGHMGGSAHEIIVDRLISLEPYAPN